MKKRIDCRCPCHHGSVAVHIVPCCKWAGQVFSSRVKKLVSIRLRLRRRRAKKARV